MLEYGFHVPALDPGEPVEKLLDGGPAPDILEKRANGHTCTAE